MVTSGRLTLANTILGPAQVFDPGAGAAVAWGSSGGTVSEANEK